MEKIPKAVFAVGRSQEVMLSLEQAIREKQIPECKVYCDGMIMEATAIHAAYPEFLNRDLREKIMVKGENPFMSPVFKRVESSNERKDICDSTESCIVLATSGMMNGGPVMEYFRSWVDNPKHSLVFVGYQADGTLGRRIQRGSQELTLSDGVLQEAGQNRFCHRPRSDKTDLFRIGHGPILLYI